MQDDNEDIHDYVHKQSIPPGTRIVRFLEPLARIPNKCCNYLTQLEEVILPQGLIRIGTGAFRQCNNLKEITLPPTTEAIGDGSFSSCEKLPQDFVQNLPSGLKEIGENAFYSCSSLEGFAIPASMNFMGKWAFEASGLVQVNLTTSQRLLRDVPEQAFSSCRRLQFVALSSSLEEICRAAFQNCESLVSVAIPSGTPVIVDEDSFLNCSSLCCIQLPEAATFTEDSFEGCPQELDVSTRFELSPIHRLCYYASSTTTQEELRQAIANFQSSTPVQDQFGMTPFHVFLSSETVRQDLLLVLLECYPPSVLDLKTFDYGPSSSKPMLPVDYLLSRWNLLPKDLLQTLLQAWLVRPMKWGSASWRQDMEGRACEIAAEPDKERRDGLLNEALARRKRIEKGEVMFLLELALWKATMSRNLLGREQALQYSGANIVLENVDYFLGTL